MVLFQTYFIEWTIIGLVATFLMTLFQLFFVKIFDKSVIPEFYENAKILEYLLNINWEKIYWYGFILHFLHGILGSLFLGLIIFLSNLNLTLINSVAYGLFLWIILLIIHYPITKENIVYPLSYKKVIITFGSHMLYSLAIYLIASGIYPYGKLSQ